MNLYSETAFVTTLNIGGTASKTYSIQDEKNQILTTNIWLNLVSVVLRYWLPWQAEVATVLVIQLALKFHSF